MFLPMMGALQRSRTLSRLTYLSSYSQFSIIFRTLATLRAASSSSSSSELLFSPDCRSSIRTAYTCRGSLFPSRHRSFLGSLWSAIQLRGFKTHGSDVRVGNIIKRKERIYQVSKVEHSHEGRGKATIKVELRDVDNGTKVTQRFGTDESVDRVFVQEKSFIFMCKDRDGKILLMDPDTFEQMEVSEDLFGKAAIYLKDEMKVSVQVYNDIPLSASVPKRVKCIVKEAQPPMKGIAATPKDKKVLLDNGLTVKAPPHVVVGDTLVINTEDDSYIERTMS